MELAFAAATLLHPVGLLVLCLAVFAAVHIGSRSGKPGRRLTQRQLIGGFAGLFAAALAVAATLSYVPPEEARRLGVPEANYVAALWREFARMATVVVFASLLGCAAIGVPLTVALASRGLATLPVVVLSSVPVTMAFSLAVGLLTVTGTHLVREATTLVVIHAALAFGFASGARLPWVASAGAQGP